MDDTSIFSANNHLDYSIEDIVLKYSKRGMNILQQYLDENYCLHAAQKILALKRGNVLLTTGFCVSGKAETDGPPGTILLAHALEKLDFHPVIITDEICRNLFEPEHLQVEYVSTYADEAAYEKILSTYDPVCLISIERCGRNKKEDYTNMRGISIADQTAQIDLMFELAGKKGILTIGIGDGGNEIGMGNLKDVIEEKLGLNPCTVTVDELIIATVSNWGAYALAAYLAVLQHKSLLLSYRELSGYLEHIVSLGCIDGVTKKSEPSVDGFPPDIEREILGTLYLISSAAS